MVFDNVAGVGEPEGGEGVEHPALVRNGSGKDHVEGGDPVGGDNGQAVRGGLVDFADFAADDFFHGEINLS